MVGRRGEDLSLDRIIQLVIVGILFGVTFLLISQQGDSSAYFGNFYMHDMHLITELAIASPGDLWFTYDNIRSDLPLNYSFGKEVMVDAQGFAWSREVGTHPDFNVAQKTFDHPFHLVWSKSPALLDVRPVRNAFETCDRVRTLNEVTISLSYEKDGTVQEVPRELRAGVARPLENNGLPFSDDPSVTIKIIEGSGSRGVDVSYSTNLLDGEYLGCVFKQQIVDRSGYNVTVSPGQRLDEDKVAVELRVNRKEDLSDAMLGEIIGHVIAIYRR